MRTGGDKADPEYQLAIAEAMKSQDGAIIDKQLSGIDTDAENDAAIEKTLGNIVTDSEKDENVKKDA
jgi:ribosomal protein S16